MRPTPTAVSLAVLLSFSLSLWASETEQKAEKKETFQIPYSEMRIAAVAYLDAVCSKKKQKAMADRLARVIKQKLIDNAILQEDSAMRNIMLDWAADNQKRIRKEDKKAIAQACFYFIQFRDRKFELSWHFKNSLDEEACTEILSFLRKETIMATKNASKDESKDTDQKNTDSKK